MDDGLKRRLVQTLWEATWEDPPFEEAAEIERAWTEKQIEAVLAEISRDHVIVNWKALNRAVGDIANAHNTGDKDSIEQAWQALDVKVPKPCNVT